MTCIVAIEKDNKVYMGGDRAISGPMEVAKIPYSKLITFNPSPFRKIVVGLAGSQRDIDLLKYTFNVPDHPDTIDSDKYLRTYFVDELKKVWGNAGRVEHAEGRSAVLIGYSYKNIADSSQINKLYTMGSDFGVMQYDPNEVAIGSGRYFAAGSLFSTKNLDPEERVRTAILAAASINPWVDANIDLIVLG